MYGLETIVHLNNERARCATSNLYTDTAASKDRRQPTRPSFQHRHYAEIARIVRGLTRKGNCRSEAAVRFANELEATNPRFDRARFLRACQSDDE